MTYSSVTLRLWNRANSRAAAMTSHRITSVHGHYLRAERVVSRVEAHSKAARVRKLRPRPDPRDYPACRNRNVLLPERQRLVIHAVGAEIPHRVEIIEWLAYPHDRHAVDIRGALPADFHHLSHYLPGCEAAALLEPSALAERAAHRAPYLRGNAHAPAVRLPHENALDKASVRIFQQQLLRAVVAAAGDRFR